MKNKTWVIASIISSLFILLIIVVFNYLINPNYYYSHNILNIAKSNPDERKYKTNYLKNHQLYNKYNTILLGSSVSTYINQFDFDKMKVYNYAVSGMIPQEYIYAIDYLDSLNAHEVQNIIIGLDFYTSNKNEINRIESFNIKQYIKNPKMKYLSLDHIKNYITGDELFIYYRRWENIKYANKLDNKIIKRNIDYSIRTIKKELNSYVYYTDYKKDLFKIKNKYKNKNFIIFIPPISEPLLSLILKEHFNQYQQWIKDIITVFGEIHDFAYFNEISNNFIYNFQDGRHFYPFVGTKIAKDLSNNTSKNSFILDKNNYLKWIQKLKDNLK